MGDGLKVARKSVTIMEPGFETGPVKREPHDPSKPRKSALSRGRSRDSSKGDGLFYQPDALEEFKKNKEHSPRRKVYEAKFEKFLANKSQKELIEKRAAALK